MPRSASPSRTSRTRRGVNPAIAIGAAIAIVFLLLPIVGLLQRMPWSSLGERLTSEVVVDALVLSAVTSVAATALSIVFGTPLAWTISQLDGVAHRILRALVLLPMVLPPVVAGAALLFALGRRGLVGQLLDDWFSITLPFTTAGAIVAVTFVALPFYVITVEAAMRQVDRHQLEVADTMGASSGQALRYITIPLVRPAVVAGAALAWARALGEFGATITFAGSLGGRTQTLPLATFQALEGGRNDDALVMSLILLTVSFVVLAAMRDHWLAQLR